MGQSLSCLRLFRLTLLLLFYACSSDNEYEVVDMNDYPPVTIDFTKLPYQKLSEYNFFKGESLADLIPNKGMLPFKPASELFTDYALKDRYVWMPENQFATTTNAHSSFNFPHSTVLIKTFYYYTTSSSQTVKNLVETRVMIKKNKEWLFAVYEWNEEKTEAFLISEGSTVNLTFTNNNSQTTINYQIPSTSDCMRCHTTGTDFTAAPLGIKPQNLNFNYPFSDGEKNQLLKWEETGYLENNLPNNFETTVDYTDDTQPIDKRVRSYLDVNCAHCHREGGEATTYALRLSYSNTINNQNLGFCIEPEHIMPETMTIINYLVDPGNAHGSMLYNRLITLDENYKMPPIGRTLQHDEAVEMISNWINQINMNCD